MTIFIPKLNFKVRGENKKLFVDAKGGEKIGIKSRTHIIK